MLEAARGAALVAAILAAALQAGLYYAFSCSVMPGLHRGDDRNFVATMQHINVAIINPWFMVTFLGAPLLAGLAAVLSIGGADRAVLAWAVLGFVFAGATFVITVALNVPLNTALDAAGDADRISDPTAVRTAFEAAWVRWNTVRAASSTIGVGCLAWALVQYTAGSALNSADSVIEFASRQRGYVRPDPRRRESSNPAPRAPVRAARPNADFRAAGSAQGPGELVVVGAGCSPVTLW